MYSDLKRITAIEKESFPDPYPLHEFANHLMNPRSRLFVACIDGKLVGYVLTACESRYGGKIRSIAVSPDFRGKGVGKTLMTAAMEYLSKFGRVNLLVRRTNRIAIDLYRSFSFKESGRVIAGYYLDGEDAIEFDWTPNSEA